MRTPFCALLTLGLLSADVTAVKIAQDATTTTTVDQDVSSNTGGTSAECDLSKCAPDDKNCCCGGNNVDINIKFNVDVGGKKADSTDPTDPASGGEVDACGADGSLCTEETKRE